MKRGTIIFFICLLVASNNIGQVRKSKNKVIAIAWNEDTVSSYKFVILDRSRFIYTITQKDSSQNGKKGFYTGTFQIAKDRINLTYDRGIYSKNITTYLTVEISGHYLIQHFTDNTKRVFMRISKGFDFHTKW